MKHQDIADGEVLINGNREGHSLKFIKSSLPPPTLRVTRLTDTTDAVLDWQHDMEEWRKNSTFIIEYTPNCFNHEPSLEDYYASDGVELGCMVGGDEFKIPVHILAYKINVHLDDDITVTLHLEPDLCFFND